MHTDPIRVAVIGYGLAGKVFHAPLVAACPDMRVAAIVTSDAGRAAEARSDYPDARVVGDAAELWVTPDEIDLVVVGAPNRAHVPLALSAIDAGCAVVVDKPLAPSAAQGREIVDAARAAGVMLSVFQNRRWDADFLTLRRLLAEGALGAPVRFESRIDRWRPAVADRWRERPGAEEAGGVLFDLGSHLIDQAIVLFGPPVSVHAEVDRRRPGAQVDDDVFISLAHAGGERSHLGASMLVAVPAPRLRLVGLAGTYEIDDADGQEDALAGGARPGPAGWGEALPVTWGRLSNGTETTPVRTEVGEWTAYYSGVARAMRGQGPPPVDPMDAVRVLEVIEDAARQAS